MKSSILDLLRENGHDLKKAANTNGGEYSGACPWCGGDDRFRVWPENERNSHDLRQSRRLDFVNRSKRFKYEPPEGGYSSNIPN
jgi:hypothetical protein